MAPLGWSGGSQFSSTELPVGAPIMVSIRGGEGAVGIAMQVPRYIMRGAGRHGQNDVNKQHATTFRIETCVHHGERVAIVFQQLLYVLLLMPTCHLSPLSIVATFFSLAPLLTDVPSVDHTLIL